MQEGYGDLFGFQEVKKLAPWPDNYCEIFWAVYPLKAAKKRSMAALQRLRMNGHSWNEIIEGARRYAAWLAQGGAGVWRPAPKHPATWLNGECWNDVLPSYEKMSRRGSASRGRTSFGDIARDAYGDLTDGR